MQRIELGDFLVIAESHTGIDAHQLARIDRVVVLAESALAAPFSGFGDVELFPTLVEKASVYAARIATYHPLPDGNKRTAYDVMVEFVERNGAAFTHGPGGLAETAQMIEDPRRRAHQRRRLHRVAAWAHRRIGERRRHRSRLRAPTAASQSCIAVRARRPSAQGPRLYHERSARASRAEAAREPDLSRVVHARYAL